MIACEICKVVLINDRDDTYGEQEAGLKRSEMSTQSNSHDEMLIKTFVEQADLLSSTKAQRHEVVTSSIQ